jgi:glycosyltransferase involved in cell wall biosynthesis
MPCGNYPPPGEIAEAQKPQNKPLCWLFLSRLHPKKQLPVLFEALSLVRHQAPQLNWQLHIAGEGEPAYLAELQQQAAALEINDRLLWHGFVSGEAKQTLLQQADWFLLPSAAENFGIAVAEALAHGVPAVLSPGVALADQVAEAGAGFSVKPTPLALAQALLNEASRPPSQALRLAARQLAEQSFSWPAITNQLILRYQQALSP